jgi:hypothetical protein
MCLLGSARFGAAFAWTSTLLCVCSMACLSFNESSDVPIAGQTSAEAHTHSLYLRMNGSAIY